MPPDPESTPRLLKALGRQDFPRLIDLPGGRYRLETILKHDFFAATAVYRRGDGDRVVLKIGRTADLLGLPGRWLGRLLCRHEARLYQTLEDVPGVPAFSGTWGDCGFAHAYIPGRPLQREQRLKREFFDRLEELIAIMHARGVAYVDLEKCENIIVSETGAPYLIDFQISWHLPTWARALPLGWLQRTLQDMDGYHLLKHRRRAQLEELSSAQDAHSRRLPWHIRAHRTLTAPLQKLRRRTLSAWDPNYHRTQK